MSRIVRFAAQEIIDTIKTEGLSLGVIVSAEVAADFNDDESRAVSKAIERAGGNYYVNDDGDWVVSDVPGDYREFGFNLDAAVEDGDVLFQTGPYACLWVVTKAPLREYPSGWRAHIIEHINAGGGIQYGALIYDLRDRALDAKLITRVVSADWFRLNMQALWADVQAEIAKHDAE